METGRLVQTFPWGLIQKAENVLCSDGKRRNARTAETADTFFSIPASVKVKGKTVMGYITGANLNPHTGKISGLDTTMPGEVRDYVFVAYSYGANASLLPDILISDYRETPKMVYVVVESTPGYLPESEPCQFDTRREAESYARELANHYREDGYYSVRGSAREGWYEIMRAGREASSYDLGRVIEISRIPEELTLDYVTPDSDSDDFISDTGTITREGRYVGSYGSVRRAGIVLASLRRKSGYWPNVWITNERGNCELVELDARGRITYTGHGIV